MEYRWRLSRNRVPRWASLTTLRPIPSRRKPYWLSWARARMESMLTVDASTKATSRNADRADSVAMVPDRRWMASREATTLPTTTDTMPLFEPVESSADSSST